MNEEKNSNPQARVAVALVALLVGLTACSSATASAPVSEGDQRPLHGFIHTVQEDLFLLERAEDVLISECMARDGWKFFPVDDGDVQPPDPDRLILDQKITPQEAQRRGYEAYFGDDATRARIPRAIQQQQQYLASLTPAEQIAWSRAFDGGPEAEADYGGGVSGPVRGCLADAREEISGPEWKKLHVLSTQLQELGFLVDSQVKADERYTDALDAWRQCIAGEGHSFEDPEAAVEAGFAARQRDPASEGAADGAADAAYEPVQEELLIAVADASCRQSSGLPQVFATLTSEYEQQVVGENEAQMLQWEELRRVFRPRLRDLLRNTPLDDVEQSPAGSH